MTRKARRAASRACASSASAGPLPTLPHSRTTPRVRCRENRSARFWRPSPRCPLARGECARRRPRRGRRRRRQARAPTLSSRKPRRRCVPQRRLPSRPNRRSLPLHLVDPDARVIPTPFPSWHSTRRRLRRHAPLLRTSRLPPPHLSPQKASILPPSPPRALPVRPQKTTTTTTTTTINPRRRRRRRPPCRCWLSRPSSRSLTNRGRQRPQRRRRPPRDRRPPSQPPRLRRAVLQALRQSPRSVRTAPTNRRRRCRRSPSP